MMSSIWRATEKLRWAALVPAMLVLGAPRVPAEVLASYTYADTTGQSAVSNQPFLEPGGGDTALYQHVTLSSAFHDVTSGGLELTIDVGRSGPAAVPVTVNFYEGHLSAGFDLTTESNIVATGSVSDIPTISGSSPPASSTSIPLTGALPGRADGKYTFAVIADPGDPHEGSWNVWYLDGQLEVTDKLKDNVAAIVGGWPNIGPVWRMLDP